MYKRWLAHANRFGQKKIKQEVDMIVLKATQDKVLSVLQSVAGIVERRHTLPILANVLIRKTGTSLQVTTSDLEIQIRTEVEIESDRGEPPANEHTVPTLTPKDSTANVPPCPIRKAARPCCPRCCSRYS